MVGVAALRRGEVIKEACRFSSGDHERLISRLGPLSDSLQSTLIGREGIKPVLAELTPILFRASRSTASNQQQANSDRF